MKQLFKGLLREIVNNPNQERTVKLRGKWTNVNPSTFDPTMRVSVNPTLGKGSDMTRLMVLQDVKQTQTAIMTQFGVENPLCGVMEFRNTLTDILAIANVKNVGRYYKEVTPEIIAKIAATPKEPDAATLLAQSEMEKNRVKMATEISKSNFADRKLRVDDDFNRDQMVVKGLLDAAKIEAQFAFDVNEEEAVTSQDTPSPAINPPPPPLPMDQFSQQLGQIGDREQSTPAAVQPNPGQPSQ
jgi:hypothetical protein